MTTQTLCKTLLTFALFLTFSAQSWSQTQTPPENGTTMTQAEAEPYLQNNWGDKSKLEYFSVDNAATTNIGNAMKGPDVTHARMTLGKIDDIDYLFTIGVNAEGKLIGDYYLSKAPSGSVIGPCPRNCDSQN